MYGARGGVGEPPIADTSCWPHIPGQVTGECDAQRGLPQSLAQLRDDLGRGIGGEPVENSHQTRADVFTFATGRRWLMTGEPEKMIALLA
ncbi:Uncharacterised protein [Mycobacteroides abscessus subsp. massiliense]|nr:Uncharacterised protein [Mycobacteroides abscessus subsp. massiliense]